MLVIGNVIKKGNPEAEYVLNHRINFCSMPEMIRQKFLKGKKVIMVAGTHGKTTTASLISWIYFCAGKDPGFFIGGIPKNFGRSYRLSSGDHFIIEGDEYETAFFDKGPKFLHYLPETLILGIIEYDHADIYKSLEEIVLQFRRLIRTIPPQGTVIACYDSQNVREVLRETLSHVETFGFHQDSFWRALPGQSRKGGTEFDLYRDGKFLKRFRMSLPGDFNILNATAAIAASWDAAIDLELIAEALESFKGTHRRLDAMMSPGGVILYDDFAHHPTAIKATLKALREIHQERKIWAVLEPRSWSLRRNVFERELVTAFGPADEIIVAPIYRADQIEKADRLNPLRLVRELNENGQRASYIKEGADGIIEKLVAELAEGDVVVLMSNGCFDNIFHRLLDKLSHKR